MSEESNATQPKRRGPIIFSVLYGVALYWAAALTLGRGLYLASTAPDWHEAVPYILSSFAIIIVIIFARKIGMCV